MRFLIPLLLAASLFGCNSDKTEDGGEKTREVSVDSTLVTETSWGAIQKSTDYDGLIKIFGEVGVEDSTILGAEGIDTLLVTYIYPGTDKELIVHWRDSLHHRTIGFIETYQPNSPYQTEKGLKIGSTLRRLLELNGQPINFTGFGWDYGGYIMSFNKGALDSSKINYRMDALQDIPQGLLGDSEFNTDMPLVKENLDRIQVYSLMLNFYEH